MLIKKYMFREGYASRILADVMRIIAEEKHKADKTEEQNKNLSEDDNQDNNGSDSKDEDTN